uniref:Ubiquitin-like domain-containing protein n=1 Tax=Mesocestoides corti TaxID=53468 RepID=A0A5K3FFH2_MESCO
MQSKENLDDDDQQEAANVNDADKVFLNQKPNSYTQEDVGKAESTALGGEYNKKAISYPPLSETELYIQECSKRELIPIGCYVRNINSETLPLSYSNIGPDDFRPLSLSLRRNQTITVLNLNHNWLGDESIPLLCQVISENPNLVELKLADNQLSGKLAERFFDSLALATNLVTLDLSENQFDDAAATYIADLLSTSTTLTVLNISRNRLGENSALHIGRGLADSESLSELDISWNHICCSGKPMKQFARGLGLSKLTKLNYSFNGIGPSLGCKELVLGLKNSQFLEELDLSDNRISPQGCVILSKALATNKNLKKIKFGRNPFQSAGCFALLTGVLKNHASQLIELNFEDIVVNRDFKLLVDKAYNVLPNLRVIYGSKLITNDLTVYSLKLYAPHDSQPKKWLRALQNLQRMTNRPLLSFLNDADIDNDKLLSRYETTKALEVRIFI